MLEIMPPFYAFPSVCLSVSLSCRENAGSLSADARESLRRRSSRDRCTRNARARFYCAKTRTMKSAGSRAPRKNNGGTARERNPRSPSRLSRSVKALDVARSRESLGIVLASHTLAPAPASLLPCYPRARTTGPAAATVIFRVSFRRRALSARRMCISPHYHHHGHFPTGPPRPLSPGSSRPPFPSSPRDSATRAALHEKRKKPLEEASPSEPRPKYDRSRNHERRDGEYSAWTGSGSCILVPHISSVALAAAMDFRFISLTCEHRCAELDA